MTHISFLTSSRGYLDVKKKMLWVVRKVDSERTENIQKFFPVPPNVSQTWAYY